MMSAKDADARLARATLALRAAMVLTQCPAADRTASLLQLLNM